MLLPEIFARVLFSRIALKDILAKFKLPLGHDLPISVIDRVISRGFCFLRNFAYMRIQFHEKKTPAKISQLTVVFAHTVDIY